MYHKSVETILAIAKKTVEDVPGYGTVTVTAQAYHLGNNEHPHFSVTCEYRNGGGAAHDICLEVWPEIKPIIDLHLADVDTGEPMHAEANGFYWLAGYAGGLGEKFHGRTLDYGQKEPRHSIDDCLRILSEHLRVPLENMRNIVSIVLAEGKELAKKARYTLQTKGGPIIQEDRAIGYYTRGLFAQYVEAQKDRWKREAIAGVALLTVLGTCDPVALKRWGIDTNRLAIWKAYKEVRS